MKQHFGTDGIRGKAGVFSRDYLEKIALAALSVKRRSTVIIGRDTRESGTEIEEILTGYLLDYGARVYIAGMLPTPVLAFLAKKFNADYGIMLSASHNPPEYNGIKFFSASGEKISDAEEKEIEKYIDNPLPLNGFRKYDAVYYFGDNDYIEYINSVLSPDIKGMKICLDCANGATSLIAPKLFSALGAEVTAFNTETDGKRINENCGATSPEFLEKAMREGKYDIGFTYDGDGDRVMAVINGRLYDGDKLLYIHARQMNEEQKLKKSTLVSTVMSNMGLQKACEEHGINFLRTQVGDKYIHREIVKEGYNLGGEQSGHLIFFDYMPTGDGILSSLLTAMLIKKCNAEKLLDEINDYPSATDSYRCTPEAAEKFYTDEALTEYLKELKFDGRFVVRPSGTEPKIRILVEAKNNDDAVKYAKEIKDMLTRRLG